jgi:O-antigen ligase
MASAAGEGRLGGVGAFYAALWTEARVAATRWRLDIVVPVAMVIAWFAIRTVAGAEGSVYLLWVLAAGALALVAPRSGLVLFVATSVFFEPDTLAPTLGPRELVVLPLGLGVLIQAVADRGRWRPGLAIGLAVLLAIGTALGVVHSFARFDGDFQWHAAQSWLGNMLAPVILLIAAAYTARDGSVRVLAVAAGVAVVAAVAALVEYVAPGAISGGPLGWIGFWKDFGARLAGIVPSPNAVSALLIVPTMVLLAAALSARDLRLRAGSLVASLPLLAAHYLTFSRSPIIALYVFVVVAAWRIRRWFGVVALAVGLVVGVALLPSYLAIRSQSGGEPTIPGTVLVASDEHRLRAWGAATRMWVDAPLTGQGYLAYKALAPEYGDPVLGSPHNEWLRLFAEEGAVVGLVGLAFVVATAATLARAPGWPGTGLTAGFLGYVLAASFNNPLLFVRVSAVAFPIVGVGLALAQRARAPADRRGTGESGGDPALD